MIREPGRVASSGFATLGRKTPFHDEGLVKLTEQLNDAIDDVAEAERKGQGRSLHILLTEDGPMFAWVSQHVMEFDPATA